MKERKTMTVFNIVGTRYDFAGIRHFDGRELPIVVYLKYYDGKTHRRKVGEFYSIANALESVAEFMRRPQNKGDF